MEQQANQPDFTGYWHYRKQCSLNGCRKAIRPSQAATRFSSILIFMRRVGEDDSCHFVWMPCREYSNRKSVT